MLKRITFIFACMAALWSAQAQTIFTSGTWEEIKEKAKNEQKLIFVDLYFEGCMPCAEMDKKVFPDTTVANLLNTSFVSFKTDVFKEDIGAILSMKYAASGFPTYLFLTAEGTAIDIVSGYIGVSRFVPLLQHVMDQATSAVSLGYDKSLDMNYPEFYRNAYMERKRQVPQETVDAYLATRTDLLDELSFVVMNTFRTGEKYSQFYIDNATQLVQKYGRMPVRNRLSSLVSLECSRLGKENKAHDFEQLLEKVKPVFIHDEWGRFSGSFFNAYYEGSKDATWMLDKLDREEQTYVDWQDKSNVLAKVIIDAKDQPDLLKKLASLYQEAIASDPHPVDLYKAALIQLYLKDYEQAVDYAQRTIDKPSPYLKKEDIEKLLHAARSKNTEGFEPARAMSPKPISMN